MRWLWAILLVACTSAPAAPPDRGKPPVPLTGKREHAMANCPTAVKGATIKYTPADDGVDLTVTAKDRAAQEEIAARARLQAGLGDWKPWESKHTGRHGGPGLIGFCPIVHDATEVVVFDVAGGVRIHVRARSRSGVVVLQRVTAQRLAASTPR